MKKLFCLLLIALLLPVGALAASQPRYSATPRISGPVYAKMDKGSAQIGYVNDYSNIRVYEIYPEWLYINCDGVKGYVPRNYLNPGKPFDSVSTPPWGVEVYHYYGTAGPNGLTIRTEPDAAGEALITLGEGARISIIELNDGWGRLGYYRQYGYVDASELKEIVPVAATVDSGTELIPVATFTSYYVAGADPADEKVHGKEVNIGVNCTDMNGDILAAGETLDYDDHYGPYSYDKGYVKGPVLISTGWGLGPGGGVCQVSSTLYNVLLQLPGINILKARPHGASGITYLPLDMDAAVGNPGRGIVMVFKNEYNFDLRFEAQSQDGALFIALYRVREE